MQTAAYFTFVAAFACLGLATLARLAALLIARRRRAAATATEGLDAGISIANSPTYDVDRPLLVLGFALLTVSLTARSIAAGHGPFSNQYEFAVAFAWGIVGVALLFERRYRLPALGALVLPIALLLMWYATTMPAAIQPLPPALQNSFLLSLHVAVAVFAYGTFTVAFAAALLYLSQSGADANRQELARLDAIGYRAVTIGFPLMALVIILGAYWASIAWGRYWSWDPKETASLVTWLIYGGYLHARGVRGWRGRRAAILLVVGFIATVFTFLGNTFLGGLHSYA